jgi:hypothetical protein
MSSAHSHLAEVILETNQNCSTIFHCQLADLLEFYVTGAFALGGHIAATVS